MTTGSDELADTLAVALANDWVTPAEVHRDGVCARDGSRSHSVVLVEVGDGGIVVKRHRRDGDDVQGSRPREVAAYRIAAATPELAGLAPALVSDDPDGPLVVELVAGSDLAGLRRTRRHTDDGLLRRTAAALGRWHHHAGDADGVAPFRPWVLDAFAADRPAFLDSNDGARGLLDAAPADLPGVLARCEEAWTAGALVHGDLRFDNVVVGDGRITFIDWECAGRGDPAWDLGALAAGVLADSGVREVGDRLAPPVRGALHGLVAGYEEGGGAAPGSWGDRLGLACAARLVMHALQVAGATPDRDADEDRLAGLAVQLGSEPTRMLTAARGAA